MSFMDEYSWKQALFTFVILLLGSILIFSINVNGISNPAWNNFLLCVIPLFLFICFFPVILVEKIITPIFKNKK
jgi:ABC-type sulfate transport system substrate-binding protein